ncbi:MAG: type VII toxin-antitoxin system HepT family RNase toxin, partial [Desulfotomaculales bacterium]
DYADTFRIMGENSLLPQDFVPRLTAMAGFRNRLVHRYWDVDNKKVFSILQENLPDLYRFIDELNARIPIMFPKLTGSHE